MHNSNNTRHFKIQVPKFREFFYGWWIVAVAVILLTLMSLCVFRGMGVLMVVLQENFKWSRTQISFGALLSRVEGAALGPIEGVLIDKIGARKMIITGFSIMALGFVLFSLIQSLWQFYAVFILITLGSGIGGWLAIVSVINGWFVKRRSIAMAGAMSGIHVAGFFLPIYAMAMGSNFRTTSLVIGIFILSVAVPCVKIVRNRPEDMGLIPDGSNPFIGREKQKEFSQLSQDPKRQSDPQDLVEDFTVKQALLAPVFWILTVAHVSSTIAIVTLSLHLTPRVTDMLEPVFGSRADALTTASTVETTCSLVALPAIFISGWLGDKISKKNLIVFFLALQGLSTIVLALANSLVLAYVFAIMYGIAFGGRIPLITAIRGDYFGRSSFATIMGWSMLPNGILMAIAPVWAGWMYDNYGSYTVPFLTYSIFTLVGAFIMLFAKKPDFSK
ncbi:MAG: hypothetical protein CL781_09165 [Chloroflexi bacterium]|nr:hypothetical protein [Chloroflexota bacterium]